MLCNRAYGIFKYCCSATYIYVLLALFNIYRVLQIFIACCNLQRWFNGYDTLMWSARSLVLSGYVTIGVERESASGLKFCCTFSGTLDESTWVRLEWTTKLSVCLFGKKWWCIRWRKRMSAFLIPQWMFLRWYPRRGNCHSLQASSISLSYICIPHSSGVSDIKVISHYNEHSPWSLIEK